MPKSGKKKGLRGTSTFSQKKKKGSHVFWEKKKGDFIKKKLNRGRDLPNSFHRHEKARRVNQGNGGKRQ